jgi:2,3-dihydroxybenzoate decarboxylase
MPALIDWHAHHTPPELIGRFAAGGRAPQPDPFDSPDFGRRVQELNAANIEFQLVSQGAGLDPDRLPLEQAIDAAHEANEIIAERIAPYRDRLAGTISISLQDIPGSIREIEQRAGNGFGAVFLYARGELVTRPEMDEVFATISRLGLPIFLHGGGGRPFTDAGLAQLEDGGMGVIVSAHADAAVTDCVVRMIASSLFDRYPNLQVVIRSSGGGIPLLLNKLYWKHRGADGEHRYSDILREHFLVDCASSTATTLQFLLDTMGEARVVFGSDYCGGLGPIEKGLAALHQHPHGDDVMELLNRNSRRLLHI